jgi:hypothetical protein
MKMDINHHPDAVNYIVKLDGQQIHNAVRVDTDEGYVEVRLTNRNGKIILDGTNPYGSVTKRYFGEVELFRIGDTRRSYTDIGSPHWTGVIEVVGQNAEVYSHLDP